MKVTVDEILADGSQFRYTIMVGTFPMIGDGTKMAAAELMEYKANGSQEYMMVLPKASLLTNEEKVLMRGTFQEMFVTKKGEDVFKMPVTKLFRMRSEAWLKAEAITENIHKTL